MKIKLQPHHIAEIKTRVDAVQPGASRALALPFLSHAAEDVRGLLEHIDALDEELREANDALASRPWVEPE
jgi:hypothetical protein